MQSSRQGRVVGVVAAVAWGVAAVGGVSGRSAGAGVIYSSGFEDPPFVAGSQLVGQDGWSGLAPGPGSPPPPPNLNPSAAVVQADLPRSGQQYVRVRGADLASDPASASITSPYQAIGSYRRNVGYDAGAAGLPVVRVEADIRVDGPVNAAGGDFFSATVAAISPNGDNNGTAGEIAISSDGFVRYYAPGSPAGSTPVGTAPVTLGQYHALAVQVDFAANNVRYFVDGQALGGPLAFPAGQFLTDALSRGSMVTYALPDAAGLARGDYVARFDNFSISAVPEPASVGLLGLGAAGAGPPRRRGRR